MHGGLVHSNSIKIMVDVLPTRQCRLQCLCISGVLANQHLLRVHLIPLFEKASAEITDRPKIPRSLGLQTARPVRMMLGATV